VEQQQPQTEDVLNVKATRRSQRIRRSALPNDYEVYNTEEAMRSDNSSK
jgi:hypothetical protein